MSPLWKINPYNILTRCPVIAVLTIDNLETALPIANAIVSGGIKVLEITLRTKCALEALSLIRKKIPGIFLGAGTIISPEQLQEAIKCGVDFAVSPGINVELLNASLSSVTPLIPGISTPSDLMLGLNYGLKEFKFFPAEASGGIQLLQSLQKPFRGARFFPTGGITPHNYLNYLSLKNVLCVGASWMLTDYKVEHDDNYAFITRLVKKLVNKLSSHGYYFS